MIVSRGSLAIASIASMAAVVIDWYVWSMLSSMATMIARTVVYRYYQN
jgi:hypothetical protein